ncbi:hypothetical protein EYF80_060781 [Liparis tanakae]|uniref:Uncharacterized protein n=1 Tax=Liparis tanakae TaxID=230148 RepID=A0A4Z2EKA8_9TELE|nr:hypothetical protein EYF80_060781 [Liparis tanakae]
MQNSAAWPGPPSCHREVGRPVSHSRGREGLALFSGLVRSNQNFAQTRDREQSEWDQIQKDSGSGSGLIKGSRDGFRSRESRLSPLCDRYAHSLGEAPQVVFVVDHGRTLQSP